MRVNTIIFRHQAFSHLRMPGQRQPNGSPAFCGPKTNTLVTITSTRRQRMIEAHRHHRVGVPVQRRMAFASRHLPDSDGFVYSTVSC